MRTIAALGPIAVALFSSGWAIAQAGQAPAVQSEPVTSAQPNAMIQAIPVGNANNTGAVSRPKDRVDISYFSIADCQGLGGVVVETNNRACGKTGKICYRADQDGVIHSACITE